MIASSYFNVIAKLCSLLVALNAYMILSNDVLPILINHPNSNLIYNPRFGFQIFSQTIEAYLLLFFGLLLYSRSRRIWQIVLIIMLIVIVCNIFLLANYSLVAITIIVFIFLIATHKIYDQGLYISYGIIFFDGLLVFALYYGIIGVYLLRTNLTSTKSLHDAIYFCIVTL